MEKQWQLHQQRLLDLFDIEPTESNVVGVLS